MFNIRNIKGYYSKHKDCLLVLINVIAQIATIVVAVVALFALRESVFQRESMYRPELRIGESTFCADIRNIDNIKYFKVNGGVADLKKDEKAAWFRINNIGMGSALSVSVDASFSRELMSPLLKSDNPEIDENNLDNVFDTLVNGTDTLILFNCDYTRNWRVDYVLPISQNSEECNLNFSQSGFKTILKCFLYLKNADAFDDFYDFLIPVELKYKDINGKQYTKENDMLIRCTFIDDNNSLVLCQIKSGQPYKEGHKEFKKKVREKDIIQVYKTK